MHPYYHPKGSADGPGGRKGEIGVRRCLWYFACRGYGTTVGLWCTELSDGRVDFDAWVSKSTLASSFLSP